MFRRVYSSHDGNWKRGAAEGLRGRARQVVRPFSLLAGIRDKNSLIYFNLLYTIMNQKYGGEGYAVIV
jgi:hypothetical protein